MLILLAGVMRTSDRRHGSVGEMYANQRHMMVLVVEFAGVWNTYLLDLYGRMIRLPEVECHTTVPVMQVRIRVGE